MRGFFGWIGAFVAIVAMLAALPDGLHHASVFSVDARLLGVGIAGMMNYRESQLTRVVAVAGQRAVTRLRSAVQTAYLDIMLRAQLDVTVAGANVRNRGSLLAAIGEIGLVENGRDRWNLDARSLGMLSEAASPSAITKTRLGAVGVATTQLVEPVRMYFAHPFAVEPMETAFIEKDPRQNTEFFINLLAAGADQILTGGTKALTAVTADVVQVYDPFRQKRPLFIPAVRQTTRAIAAASAQEELFIRTTNHVRAILIQQDTSVVGEVNDIINNFVLRGDNGDIYGPEMNKFQDAIRRSEFDFGGLVGTAAASSNGSYLLLNFQRNGRLASVLNPSQAINLRFQFDCQPSVTAGATNSTIRVTVIELEHTNAGLDFNGKALVDQINFAV